MVFYCCLFIFAPFAFFTIQILFSNYHCRICYLGGFLFLLLRVLGSLLPTLAYPVALLSSTFRYLYKLVLVYYC